MSDHTTIFVVYPSEYTNPGGPIIAFRTEQEAVDYIKNDRGLRVLHYREIELTTKALSS